VPLPCAAPEVPGDGKLITGVFCGTGAVGVLIPSGARCSITCAPGLAPSGNYLCMGGSYIEVPTCLPVGIPSALQHTVAGTLQLELGGHSAAVSESTSVVDLALLDAVASAIAEGLSAVSTEQVHIKTVRAPAHRRLMLLGGGRRLAGNSESDQALLIEVDFEVWGAASESDAAVLAAQLVDSDFDSSLQMRLQASLPSLEVAAIGVTHAMVVVVHTLVVAGTTQPDPGAFDTSAVQPNKYILLASVGGVVFLCIAAALCMSFWRRCWCWRLASAKTELPGSSRHEWRGSDWEADADAADPRSDGSAYEEWLREYTDSIKVLGLPRGSVPTPEGLRQAYRKAALRWHPDRPHNAGVPEASAMFIRSRTAYEFLSKCCEPAADAGV